MHTIKYLGPIVFSTILQINAQAQNELSNNLSMAERMKKIMYENYESSHRLPTDSIPKATLNGQHTSHDPQGKILKEGVFKDGLLRDGYVYRYGESGQLIEKHIYRNGRFLTKE